MSLARALLIDEDSVLDVARVQNELEKLRAFADGKVITPSMVGDLTENTTGVDIFELLNAIATKNKKLAMQMLDQYFLTESADEKTNAIKVVALLSDQFRSLLITVDANDRRMPDEQILQITGWKSGRLFIMKKLSRNFNMKQLKSAVAKLQNLDRELKTGSMPPHVVLDLIIADM
jgi:DNA polymerase III subunit delta